ncbi:uncharacterized protein TNCV_242941 [Trichonephila clavipes]|uniref:Uncharacterized protein n=1 Tax=Trichonephila clavipes TaxID=2585209 RepID=A0A8X7BEM7_TRICX|nr:uncharacterized protein TNCV_242941 [Trichonephila clavipes]
MGSFHHRYPTESGEFAGSKSGFRRHRGFPISFREMHLNRAPSKNQSLRGRSFATALSKNSYRCEGLTPAPSKTQSFIAAGASTQSTLQSASRSHQFRRIPCQVHGRRCLGTHCVFPDALSSPERKQTKHIVDASLVTPRTKFRNSFAEINEKTGISATLAARAWCP